MLDVPADLPVLMIEFMNVGALGVRDVEPPIQEGSRRCMALSGVDIVIKWKSHAAYGHEGQRESERRYPRPHWGLGEPRCKGYKGCRGYDCKGVSVFPRRLMTDRGVYKIMLYTLPGSTQISS